MLIRVEHGLFNLCERNYLLRPRSILNNQGIEFEFIKQQKAGAEILIPDSNRLPHDFDAHV
ncbi:MAG TPA: hypothetical protein VMW34_12300 [Anaerolineales bacterium]|nr:hypothetical protein [Anaerolineales bacterium]